MLVQRRKRQNNNTADRGKAVPHPAKADGVDADTGKDEFVKEGNLSRSGLSKNQVRISALANGASSGPNSSSPVGPNSNLKA